MISIADVEYVAKLARLSLTDEEKRLYSQQLSAILDHFNQLKNLDTANIKPLSSILSNELPLREDVLIDCPGSKIILNNAPDIEDSYFKVPKIGE